MNLYPATEDHLEEIMEIDKEAFPTPWSRKLWIKEISRTHRAYHVAIENKKVMTKRRPEMKNAPERL